MALEADSRKKADMGKKRYRVPQVRTETIAVPSLFMATCPDGFIDMGDGCMPI